MVVFNRRPPFWVGYSNENPSRRSTSINRMGWKWTDTTSGTLNVDWKKKEPSSGDGCASVAILKRRKTPVLIGENCSRKLRYICEKVQVTLIRERNHVICCKNQQTQNILITFVQRRHNVFDVGSTLYKCYTNILCLLGWSILFLYYRLF